MPDLSCTFSNDDCCNAMTFFLFIAVIVLIYFAVSKLKSQPNATVGDNNILMFGRESCPWCKKQKSELGGLMSDVEYVNCENNPEKCSEYNITALPTWFIYGNKTEGFITKDDYQKKIKKNKKK